MIKQTLKYYRQLAAEVPGLRTVLVSDPDALSAAKELHARTYLRVGIQPPQAVTEHLVTLFHAAIRAGLRGGSHR